MDNNNQRDNNGGANDGGANVQEKPPPQPQQQWAVRDFCMTVVNENLTGIVNLAIAANNFELKPALIHMMQHNQFEGQATVKMNGISNDAIRLCLFPFSLRDRAKSWLQSLPLGSITTWDEMERKFIVKFFPPSKFSQLRMDASADFYNGLNGPTRNIIDVAAAGGELLGKTVDEAFNLMEEMAINSCQWPNKNSMPQKVAGLLEVYPMTSIVAHITTLSNQVGALTTKSSPSIIESVVVASQSGVCLNQEQAQYVSNGNYNYQSNNIPNYYHSRLRNNENLSYTNNKNVLQLPRGFNAQPQAEKKQSLEDILGTFMMETNKRFNKNKAMLDNIETHMTNIGATIKSIEVQVEQLATTIGSQQKGNFPSDTEVNPNEQCKVIDLRSGKEIEGGVTKDKKILPMVDNKIKSESVVCEIEKEEIVAKNNINEKPTMKKDNPPMYQPLLPYPQRFLKKNLDEKFAKFLEIFKKININIPFVDALEKMSSYVKFIKEVMSKKRKFEDYDTVKLTEECSAILQKKVAPKAKGSSINLMLSSDFKKLGLGEVNPTTITLQLVDRSFTYPRGVIGYVLVKLDTSFDIYNGMNWPVTVNTCKRIESFSKEEICVDPLQPGSEKISSKEHLPTVMAHFNVYKEKTKKVYDK
ncbi:uncharacterized protein LOC133785642 [Humulus lupulus]|uniref:uncharacterized protein LOC133785642 n=1 Tax=Humulus lupulus TaxID=3486 RepID=UPI002B40E144|nr:uncharacterized protein LOC133785642 [Humulus lupulus]